MSLKGSDVGEREGSIEADTFSASSTPDSGDGMCVAEDGTSFEDGIAGSFCSTAKPLELIAAAFL